MAAAITAIYRLFIVAVCVWATTSYIRWSRADWLASKGLPEPVERALQLEPANSDLLRRVVTYRNNAPEASWVTDAELRRAVRANPLEAELWMALGLREELEGNDSEAEADLVRAADVDHQFMPAWTLASYYYRTDQGAKAWPLLQRCLNLDRFGANPSPVFDLAWNLSDNEKKIQTLIPANGNVPIQYLEYLVSTDRPDAAIHSWPAALAASSTAPKADGSLVYFPDYLIQKERIPDAVDAWNELVKRGFIASGRLDPGAGKSVADPDFRYPPLERAFGWRVSHAEGLFVSAYPSDLRLEFDGNEPEAFSVLSAVAPVVPGRSYRLTVKLDPSGLKNQQDAGFTIRVGQKSGETIAECPIFEAGKESATCEVAVPQDVRQVLIELDYKRASGTVRAKGTLRVLNVALGFAA